MGCHRCGGLMVFAQLRDIQFGSSGYESVGRRCINCGAIVDSLIAVHQRHDPVIASQSQEH